MSRMLARLALRQTLARPGAAAVTVAGVALGAAGVRAMTLGVDGALATLGETYARAAGPADLVALPAGDPRGFLPEGAAERLGHARGVRAALPMLVQPAVRAEELSLWMGVVLPGKDAGVEVIGVDPGREAGLGRWEVAEGDGAPACGPGEGCPAAGARVLVGDAWARDRGLGPGDALRLFAGSKLVELRIAGTVDREGLGGRGGGRVVIAPIGAVRDAFGLPEGAVQELAIAGGDPGDLAEAAGPGTALVRPGERGGEVAQKLANLRAATDLLRGVTLLLAGLLVAGQASARAAERARMHGLLRAIGATRAQAIATMLLEVSALAVVGAALGVVGGGWLATGVAAALGQGAQADLAVSPWNATGAIPAFVGAILVAIGAAAVPAWRAARGEPLEAVRARGEAAQPPPAVVNVGSVILLGAALGSLWGSPASVSDRGWTLARLLVALGAAAALLPAATRFLPAIARGRSGAARLGVASLRWRPVRSGLAAGSVLLCVAMVGGAAALAHGLRDAMDDWSGRALGWDLYASRPDGFTDGDLVEIRAIPGVEEASGVSVRAVAVGIRGKPTPLSLLALDPASYAHAGLLTVVDETGARVPEEEAARTVASLAEGGALATTVVAAQMGLHLGDTVSVPGASGSVPVPVRGFVVDYTQNGFALLVSQDLLRATQGGDRLDLVVVRGAEARGALAALPGVRVESRAELRGRLLGLVDASLRAFDVLSWLAGAVGVLAVAAALAQGAVERRADLAVLRAVGMERGRIAGMLAAEGVATAALGVAAGIPLGVVSGWVFTGASGTLGVALPFHPAWGAMLGASAVSVGTAALAAWVPARRAARISPAEALREG